MSTQEYKKLRDEILFYLKSNNISHYIFIDSENDLVCGIIVNDMLNGDQTGELYTIFNELECDVMDILIVKNQQIEIFPFESESNE